MNHEDMKTIIESTFRDMIEMAKEPNSEDDWPKLIWPRYSPLKKYSQDDDKTKRFSEQELKQKFVDNLRDYCKCDYLRCKDNLRSYCKCKEVYYSVETPTVDDYYFSGDVPVCVRQQKKFKELKRDFISVDSSGQSGNFDLTIYDSNQVIQHHIEFKSGNPDAKEITKDLLKLANEPWCEYCRDELRKKGVNLDKYKDNKKHYFIHILKDCNERTLDALSDKFLCIARPKNEDDEHLKILKESLKDLIAKSNNEIYVYVLSLKEKAYYFFKYDKEKAYYFFKYDDVKDKINWDRKDLCVNKSV